MPANNRYMRRWRNWIEKKKLLTKEEIDEIETYLIDKMESIQNQKDVSDRSAFNQALDLMGEQGLLAEEYTKIRKSPFDKLRWWVMAQSTVSVFLVVFILISHYKNLPTKPVFFSLLGERIGYINTGKVSTLNTFNTGTFQNALYLSDTSSNNIFCFSTATQTFPEVVCLFEGTYFNLTNPIQIAKDAKYLHLPIFIDVDNNGKLYCLFQFGREIKVFDQGVLDSMISLPDNLVPNQVISMKIYKDLLILCVTDHPLVKQNDRFIREYQSSFLYIHPLQNGKNDNLGFKKIALQSKIIAMDTTEDNIVAISIEGVIEKFRITIPALAKVNITKMDIHPFIDAKPYNINSLNPDISLFCTETDDKMILNYRGLLYIISPQENNTKGMSIILDQNIKNVIKLKVRNKERLVLIVKKEMAFIKEFSKNRKINTILDGNEPDDLFLIVSTND